MAKDNKTQTVMIGTRVQPADSRRYQRLARNEHRKLAEVIRKLLADWAAQAEKRSAA